MIFGGITIVCGILGTLAGGLVLDYMTNTLSNAFKVGIWIIVCTLALFIFMFMHFLIQFFIWWEHWIFK